MEPRSPRAPLQTPRGGPRSWGDLRLPPAAPLVPEEWSFGGFPQTWAGRRGPQPPNSQREQPRRPGPARGTGPHRTCGLDAPVCPASGPPGTARGRSGPAALAQQPPGKSPRGGTPEGRRHVQGKAAKRQKRREHAPTSWQRRGATDDGRGAVGHRGPCGAPGPRPRTANPQGDDHAPRPGSDRAPAVPKPPWGREGHHVLQPPGLGPRPSPSRQGASVRSASRHACQPSPTSCRETNWLAA